MKLNGFYCIINKISHWQGQKLKLQPLWLTWRQWLLRRRIIKQKCSTPSPPMHWCCSWYNQPSLSYAIYANMREVGGRNKTMIIPVSHIPIISSAAYKSLTSSTKPQFLHHHHRNAAAASLAAATTILPPLIPQDCCCCFMASVAKKNLYR